MSSELQNIFESYLQTVEDQLRLGSECPQNGVVKLVRDSEAPLREATAKLEKSDVFRALIDATESTFSIKKSVLRSLSVNSAVSNFFRRSSCYTNIAAGSGIEPSKYFEQFKTAFESKETTIRFFAPLEFVQFSEDSMNFGEFEIRRFSTSELEKIFQTEINKVFYRWAITDIGKLSEYWFIVKSSTTKSKIFDSFVFSANDFKKVKTKFTEYPQLDKALLPLACFRWQEDGQRIQPHDAQDGWSSFQIPFVIEVPDNLIESPPNRPPLSDLVMDLYGEHAVEGPLIHTYLDDKETQEFKSLVSSIESNLGRLQTLPGWEFFDRAGQYLLKAFFAEGLEQLLWHVTTIDALLGDEGPGMSKRLANRVARILEENDEGQKLVKERLKKIYNLRSVLVHGAEIRNQPMQLHLFQAREYTRQIYLWSVNFLDRVRSVTDQNSVDLPARATLLKMIDLDFAERSKQRTILEVLEEFPEEFPTVSNWID